MPIYVLSTFNLQWTQEPYDTDIEHVYNILFSHFPSVIL